MPGSRSCRSLVSAASTDGMAWSKSIIADLVGVGRVLRGNHPYRSFGEVAIRIASWFPTRDLLWSIHRDTYMPISSERFEEKSDERLALEDGTPADRIRTFLAEHDDRAFTRTEIAARLGIKHRTVGTVLSRLEDRGLVRHKGRHWTIGTDDGGPSA